ncbi:MAG: hypothetical protein DMG68_22250, partial [Acidobacteria bacterium]
MILGSGVCLDEGIPFSLPGFFLPIAEYTGGAVAPGGCPAQVLSQYFEEKLADDPEFATSIGRHDYDDRWTDWSK